MSDSNIKKNKNGQILFIKILMGFCVVDSIGVILSAIILFTTNNNCWWIGIIGIIWIILSLFPIVFLSIIYDLIKRVNLIEFVLDSNGIKLKQTKQKESLNKNAFRAGEPIKLKSNNANGMVKKVLDNNHYEIELDNDIGKYLIVKEEDLKSYFDIDEKNVN